MEEKPQLDLKGLIVPVLTPFKENGEIDQDAFKRHLDFLMRHGVEKILVNGTTAEFYSLLPEERRELLELARRHFSGILLSHACGLGLAMKGAEVQWANEVGADAVVVLPPIYPAGISSEDMVEYFNFLEERAHIPFILYNFPKHSGNAITPEVLKAVPHYGVKDSAQNLALMEHTPRYFIGSSSKIYEPVLQGAAGFVSGAANVRPELYAAMEMLLQDANVGEAAVMQQEIQAYSHQFSGGGIALLKQALSRKLPGYPLGSRCPTA
ncbi:MAG TPA: dihydrodipicolinate synthase family protein [Pontiella sp.]